MGGGRCIHVFTEYMPSNGERQKPGGWWRLADGEEGGLSWLEWICVLAQWADASGAPRQLSQKAAVVSPL